MIQRIKSHIDTRATHLKQCPVEDRALFLETAKLIRDQIQGVLMFCDLERFIQPEERVELEQYANKAFDLH